MIQWRIKWLVRCVFFAAEEEEEGRGFLLLLEGQSQGEEGGGGGGGRRCTRHKRTEPSVGTRSSIQQPS